MNFTALSRWLVLGCCSCMLMACALSPQTINIAPTINLSVPSYGAGRDVRISAEDARQNKVIGSRGGVYENSAQITVANDIVEALVKSGNAQMAAQGFRVNSDNPDAAHIVIVLDDLIYDTPDTSMLRDISVGARLHLEASYLGNTYRSEYQTKKNHSFVSRPDAADNEKLINDVLAETLERLFSDAKLHAFLLN